jgi:hypothetical protein
MAWKEHRSKKKNEDRLDINFNSTGLSKLLLKIVLFP